MDLFRRKTIESVREISNSSGLSKSLTAFDLIIIGLGAIIGTGVFVFTGAIAAKHSGPAVMISYAIAGGICILVALAYSELAVMLPTSGSIYTYCYVAFGEIFAWLMLSILLLELTFGAAAVAAGWAGYVLPVLEAAGLDIPEKFTKVPADGGIANLLAIFVVGFVTLVVYLGTKDSKRLNAILVFIKLGAIVAFVIAAIPNFKVHNWDNFMPFGFGEVLTGASILFFAFNGFTIIPTAAEECKNPTRDITIGIIGALVLTTLVYVVIGGLLTGIAPFATLSGERALADALKLNNSNVGAAIVSIGGICGMTTVLMMNIYGTSRIVYSIARDGLLPRAFSKLHPKTDVPYIALFSVAILAAALTGFFPYKQLGQLTSMGALLDYIIVTIIVVMFRITLPNVERKFKCPILFILAPISIVACVFLLSKQLFDNDYALTLEAKYLFGWIFLIFVLYFPISFFKGKSLKQ
ncbi:MAG: amino acid permease [Rickettsiaceae bacterium]|nr:amino acid permease [Rickettsiaceae bacterium]